MCYYMFQESTYTPSRALLESRMDHTSQVEVGILSFTLEHLSQLYLQAASARVDSYHIAQEEDVIYAVVSYPTAKMAG